MKDYGTFRRHIWALPLELVMAGAVAVTFSYRDWPSFLSSLFTFSVSFAPLIFERMFKVRLSALVQTMYVAFIFASMFAGEVFRLYRQIIIWDDITHFVSGLLVGLGVMMWLSVLTRKYDVKMPPWFQGVFIFCAVAAVAVLWEVVEFACDQWFGMTTQDDLFDTMFDMIYALAGGTIMTMLSALHLNGRHIAWLYDFFDHFQRTNK